MRQYSLVFLPPPNHIAYVRSKKDELANTISWYHNRNSIAHITVLEFVIHESRLCDVLSYLEKFCNDVQPFEVSFNCIGVLGKAICLAPSISSRNFLSAIMKALSARFPFESFKSTNPHMTIGRRLSGAQIDLATSRFATENPKLIFQANAFYLREFNEVREQYDVIAEIGLRGNEESMSRFSFQTALFD